MGTSHGTNEKSLGTFDDDSRYGAFLGHGATQELDASFFFENPSINIYKWMRTGGTPFQDRKTSISWWWMVYVCLYKPSFQWHSQWGHCNSANSAKQMREKSWRLITKHWRLKSCEIMWKCQMSTIFENSVFLVPESAICSTKTQAWHSLFENPPSSFW